MKDEESVQIARILRGVTLETCNHVDSLRNRLSVIEGRLRLLEASSANSGCLPAFFAFITCIASLIILMKLYFG